MVQGYEIAISIEVFRLLKRLHLQYDKIYKIGFLRPSKAGTRATIKKSIGKEHYVQGSHQIILNKTNAKIEEDG